MSPLSWFKRRFLSKSSSVKDDFKKLRTDGRLNPRQVNDFIEAYSHFKLVTDALPPQFEHYLESLVIPPQGKASTSLVLIQCQEQWTHVKVETQLLWNAYYTLLPSMCLGKVPSVFQKIPNEVHEAERAIVFTWIESWYEWVYPGTYPLTPKEKLKRIKELILRYNLM